MANLHLEQEVYQVCWVGEQEAYQVCNLLQLFIPIAVSTFFANNSCN